MLGAPMPFFSIFRVEVIDSYSKMIVMDGFSLSIVTSGSPIIFYEKIFGRLLGIPSGFDKYKVDASTVAPSKDRFN